MHKILTPNLVCYANAIIDMTDLILRNKLPQERIDKLLLEITKYKAERVGGK